MSMTFRRAVRRPPVSREVAARQVRLLKATQALVTADATRDFLNNNHPRLGGRPLDIALQSEAGLLEVERVIRAELETLRGANRPAASPADGE